MRGGRECRRSHGGEEEEGTWPTPISQRFKERESAILWCPHPRRLNSTTNIEEAHLCYFYISAPKRLVNRCERLVTRRGVGSPPLRHRLGWELTRVWPHARGADPILRIVRHGPGIDRQAQILYGQGWLVVIENSAFGLHRCCFGVLVDGEFARKLRRAGAGRVGQEGEQQPPEDGTADGANDHAGVVFVVDVGDLGHDACQPREPCLLLQSAQQFIFTVLGLLGRIIDLEPPCAGLVLSTSSHHDVQGQKAQVVPGHPCRSPTPNSPPARPKPAAHGDQTSPTPGEP
eukprot:688588-Rhodomonas_salina.2